jgi:hypothetical protein
MTDETQGVPVNDAGTPEGYVDIEVPEEIAMQLVAFGFATKDEEGVVTMTPKGSKWLREYCGKKIAEHVEVGPLDEPSMEDYPTLDDRNSASVVGVPWNKDGYAGLVQPDDFGAPPVKVVTVRDGVRDTKSR